MINPIHQNNRKVRNRLAATVALAAILLLSTGSAWCSKTVECFVSGDTSANSISHPLGSKKNPYASLAEVEANAQCDKVIVLWSGSVLDGGIALRPGQTLEGERGPNGELPGITNSSAASNAGHGVLLAADNTLRHLHILDTWSNGIEGFDVGSLRIQDVRVTGYGQSGETGDLLGLPFAHVGLSAVSVNDSDIEIRQSDMGESDGTSVAILQLSGTGQVDISGSSFRDQGYLEGTIAAPGVLVFALADADINLLFHDIMVSNIGGGFSNSDGLAALNWGSGAMNVEVDRYYYYNPDGDGGGSATGIEMGMYLSTGGGSFAGSVTNSLIVGSTSAAIQVLDQWSTGGYNTLVVNVENNVLVDNFIGVNVPIAGTPDSDVEVTVANNQIVNSSFTGILAGNWASPLDRMDVRIEYNSIENSGDFGMFFFSEPGTVPAPGLDAGLGGTGSAGFNRIVGSFTGDVFSDGAEVSAGNNWWGSASGPTGIVEINGGSVDPDPYLLEDPGK